MRQGLHTTWLPFIHLLGLPIIITLLRTEHLLILHIIVHKTYAYCRSLYSHTAFWHFFGSLDGPFRTHRKARHASGLGLRPVRPRIPAHACSYAAGAEGREFPPALLIRGRVRTGSLGASQQNIHRCGENVLRTLAYWYCHRVHVAAASISSDLALLRYPSCCTDTSRIAAKTRRKRLLNRNVKGFHFGVEKVK